MNAEDEAIIEMQGAQSELHAPRVEGRGRGLPRRAEPGCQAALRDRPPPAPTAALRRPPPRLVTAPPQTLATSVPPHRPPGRRQVSSSPGRCHHAIMPLLPGPSLRMRPRTKGRAPDWGCPSSQLPPWALRAPCRIVEPPPGELRARGEDFTRKRTTVKPMAYGLWPMAYGSGLAAHSRWIPHMAYGIWHADVYTKCKVHGGIKHQTGRSSARSGTSRARRPAATRPRC